MESYGMKKSALPLLAILFIALLVRIPGINYGLPFLYSADESYIVHVAGQLASGHLQAGYFVKPLLFHFLLISQYGGYYTYCLLTGIVDNLETFKELYYSNPTWFYLLARLTSLFLGVLSILAIYK